MAEELEIGNTSEQRAMSGVMTAIEGANERDAVTRLLDYGRCVAAVVPPEAAEAYERWTGYRLAGPLQSPVAELRRQVQERLVAVGHPDLAAIVPADPGQLASWLSLLTKAEAGRRALTS